MPWAVDTPFWTHAANYSGRTPRMIMMDDPSKVVDVIVHAARRPREEVPAGWKAHAGYISHRLFPDLSESVSASVVHRVQMEKGAPAPPTSGTLHTPMQTGQGVEGGTRERMKQEDQQQR